MTQGRIQIKTGTEKKTGRRENEGMYTADKAEKEGQKAIFCPSRLSKNLY